jgi:hypothetical protein
MEMGVLSGGGIRRMDKADLSISRGIKMDSLPAWADHGRGRGRGGLGRGSRGGNSDRGGNGGVRGARGRGGRGGGGGGSRSRGRGRGGRGGRGTIKDLTGSNAESVPERKGKRKLTADKTTTDEIKKVKLMELALEAPPASVPAAAAASTKALPSSSSSSFNPTTPKAISKNSKKKSLLDLLLTGGEIDAGKGFGLFD